MEAGDLQEATEQQSHTWSLAHGMFSYLVPTAGFSFKMWTIKRLLKTFVSSSISGLPDGTTALEQESCRTLDRLCIVAQWVLSSKDLTQSFLVSDVINISLHSSWGQQPLGPAAPHHSHFMTARPGRCFSYSHWSAWDYLIKATDSICWAW